MSAGQDIAAEISAALREVGEETGQSPFTVTLIKPGEPTGDPWNPIPGEPDTFDLLCLKQNERIRDRDGTLIGQTLTEIMVEAKPGVVPMKSDKILLDGVERDIREVIPTDPGGVALYFTISLENA